MTDRQDDRNKQQNTNQDVRASGNSKVTAIANAQADTINIVNNTDRNVSLDDWKPSFEHMQGRKEAIAAINIALADPKKAIACIVGLGGYGKSTLAAKLFDGWKGGRFWADLSQRSRDFREFATRAIAQLGQKSLEQVNNLPETQLGYELAAVLQGQDFLVVLDNLESLFDGDGNLESVLWREFLQNWANDGEGSKVLITTREVPNLPKLRFSRHELSKGLEESEGAAVLRDFGILGIEVELVEVSQRVGGIPLSLMLIVGLLCNDYEEEPHVRFLPEDLFGIEGAHRLGWVTTEAVFRASFERLEPRLQNLLIAVSVFAKPFDCKMAAALIVDEEVTDRDLLLLKKRGFVLAESGCYRFQPQIQELVKRQAESLTKFHRKAISYYCKNSKPTLDPCHDTLEDADSYLQIFHHYCELGEHESAFYTIRNGLNTNDIDSFLHLSGYRGKLVDLHKHLINVWHPDKLKQWEYKASLNSLGLAYHSLGKYQQAITSYQRSLELEQTIGDKQGEAVSLGNLGNAYDFLGQYQQAINFQEQSLEIEREIGNKQGESKSLGNLGNIYFSLGQYEKSIEFHLLALEIAREICDRQWEAGSLGNLGNAYCSLGKYEKAIFLYGQSLEIAKVIGDKQGEANSLANLGSAYNSPKKYQQAISFYQQSLEIQRTINDEYGESCSIRGLGDAYNFRGDFQKAISLYQQSLEISQAIFDKQGEARSLSNLGNAYTAIGHYQKAISLYQQSLRISQLIDDKHGEANSLTNLAATYFQVGRFKKAFFALNRANQILQELQLPLNLESYTEWLILFIRFAQRGKWQIALCFCIGLFVFPLFLAYLVALFLWRFIKGKVKSRK